MIARAAVIAVLVALVDYGTASAAPPEPQSVQAPAAKQVWMSGGFTPVVQIPVTDPTTKVVWGALFVPEGAGAFPTVVLLSGCANWDLPWEAAIAKRVIADYLPMGIATLVLDSFTPRGVMFLCSDNDAMYRAVNYRVDDVYAAIAWLNGRPKIDAKHIFIQGYSHGAWVGIRAVSPEVRATHPQQPIAGVIAVYPYCENVSSRFAVPTVILIGQEDDWTPASRCNFVDKTNVEVTIYPGAQHDFAAPGLDMMYLGHHLAYQEEAANDAQHRALAFIRSLSNEPSN